MEVTSVEYGQLTLHMGSRHWYVWRVNGVDIKFNRLYNVVSQHSVRSAVVRALDLDIGRSSQAAWDHILNATLAQMRVEYHYGGEV